MNVLVVPEDFRKDQYLLAPLFRQLFRSLGKPHAKIGICRDPLLGGVGEALKSARLAEVVAQHRGMTDIFILCVDRDGEVGRRQRLDALEGEFSVVGAFLAENAWEELETWVLAGLDLPNGWNWQEVRAEVNVKEHYFDRLAQTLGVADAPGGGRKPLGERAARRIPAIRQKCPEDFDALAIRLADRMAAAHDIPQ